VKLAFIMYDKFGILDLAGPVEVLRGWPSAEVHYVATSAAPVTTDSGMELRPTTTTDDMRDLRVVVVPGTGRSDLMLADQALIGWLRDVASAAGVSAGIDMALAPVGRQVGPEAAKVLQLTIEYDPQPPFDSGLPHKAGDEITRKWLTVLLAAARRSAASAVSIPLTLPSATETLR
jgi:transcriptional regulator GlxA family with amidase domain